MWPSVVVAVSDILLLLFHLFSLIFYCETTTWASVASVEEQLISAKQMHCTSAHTLYFVSGGKRAVHAFRVTKLASRALYVDPCVPVKTKVYFGLEPFSLSAYMRSTLVPLSVIIVTIVLQ